MKRERIAQSGLFSLRAILALLFCTAAICSMFVTETLPAFFRSEAPAKIPQRTLTFAERVSYQRAIEEVYWHHRIWPRNGGERTDPKPSLDAVMSQAQLERKVHDYLRKSQALQDYWQQPITSEQLQAEMNRMAKHTKQPEVLRELFQALGNDPLVIAECLARPILTERLVADPTVVAGVSPAPRNLLAADTAASTENRINAANLNKDTYTLPTIATTSKQEGTCIDAWATTSTVNAPSARTDHTAVWTGSEMIVWGGWGGGTNYLNTGGKYNPITDNWTATSIANAPSARLRHTAVWTGSEMIVWGGIEANGASNTGGRYNPSMDSWTATSTTNAPTARYFDTAVWSGSEMIVWGGYSGTHVLNTGGRYNPTTDSWTATSNSSAPEGRDDHTAVWNGSEMIVWGGTSDSGYLNSGGRYNQGTDSWAATTTTNAPTARNGHTAVWTGNEMIIWGGDTNTFPYYLNTGGRYNPITDSWVATSTTNTPSAREFHTAISTASDMIVWAGISNGNYVNTGGRYNPATDTWTATSHTNAPSARSDHTAVWTGSEMIVWGGSYFSCQTNQYLNTGGRYCGQYPTPTPTPTPTPIITVTNTNDRGPGSLRQALADAIDGDTIEFAVTGTVQLTSGELSVDKSIIISGPGPENLAVNGNAKSRVFHVSNPCGSVTISGLTITNGCASGNFPDNSGGGIYNDHATLTLNNCTISNSSAAYGGAIYNNAENFPIATLEVDNSSVTDNSGGALYNDGQYGGFASLLTNNVIVSNNSGGGIYNNAQNAGNATLEITDSSLSNNDGDAIHSTGFVCIFCGDGTATVQITNSSITDNSDIAIYSDTGQPGPTTVSISSSTISGNGWAVYNSTLSATAVGNSTISDNAVGIYNNVGSSEVGVSNCTMSNNGVELHSDGPSVYMDNTIFNVNPGGHSIVFNGWGTVMSFGYNLSSDAGGGYLNGPGDQINTDPLLGPLQDNGGLTFTRELLPGSPAINTGNPNFVPPPYYDQRGPGFGRVKGSRIDVGSFEVQAPPTPTPTPRLAPTPRVRPTPAPRP